MGRRAWVFVGIVGAVAGATIVGEADAKSTNHQEQALIELGRRMFFDPAVSGAGKFSCASCHDPEHGFSDPRMRSEDENGRTARHSQPVTDLGGAGFHWDGEFDTVRQLLTARLAPPATALAQARELHQLHFTAALEAGNEPDEADFRRRIQSLTPPYYGPVTPRGPIATPVPITARLELDERYDAGFDLAFGDARIDSDRVIDAMEAYLGSLRSTESPFDRYRAGDLFSLNPSQRRGLALFEGKAGCAECHTTDSRELTDGKFHNTGVAFRGRAWPLPAPSAVATVDGGRGSMSFVSSDRGSFKTASLRDIALRPPYMHDGSLATLEDVVRYYDHGGTRNVNLDEKIEPIGLEDAEVSDLVAFLGALTGDERAGLGPLPGYRPQKHTFVLLDVYGNPKPDLKVTVVPWGDRLNGTDAMPEPFELTADSRGRLEFPFPASTHVRLESPEHEIEVTRPVPDWVARQTLYVTPRDLVSVRLRLKAGRNELPSTITLRPVRAVGETDDTVYTLRRRRVVGRGKDQAIYTIDLDAIDASDRRVLPTRVFFQDGRQSQGIYEVDLAGGASDPIDLRLVAAPPETLQRTTSERRERRPSGGDGATPGRGLKEGPTGRGAPKARGE